jgi:hypothetical protein
MQHSVKNIGKNYEELSIMRNDKIKFNQMDFFNFAKENIYKYRIIKSIDDLLISTWYVDDLTNDYRKLLYK